MNRVDMIKKELKEDWFKNHKAELIECGDFTVMNWSANGSSNYSVRYVLEGLNLYISGDIGEAVFRFNTKTTLSSIGSLDLESFLRKMVTCSNGMIGFDGEYAKKNLEKLRNDLLGEDCEFTEKQRVEISETVDEMIVDAYYCKRDAEWQWRYARGKYGDFAMDYNCVEELSSIGSVVPYKNFGFLVGLQMAFEQLSGE